MPAGFTDIDDGDKTYGGKPYTRDGADPFEDDEGPSAYSFSNPQSGPYARKQSRSRWARIKEDHLTDVDWTLGLNKLLRRKSKFDGVPRELALNDPEANRVKGFENNSVSTGNYGPITFLPKFLFCEFNQTSSALTCQPNSPGPRTCSSCSLVSPSPLRLSLC